MNQDGESKRIHLCIEIGTATSVLLQSAGVDSGHSASLSLYLLKHMRSLTTTGAFTVLSS